MSNGNPKLQTASWILQEFAFGVATQYGSVTDEVGHVGALISRIKRQKSNKGLINTQTAQQNRDHYLWEISVLEVCSGHAVQPGSSQFRGAGVGPGQAILEVQKHLWVFLMLPHLGCGHQHCSDALGQTLHFRGKRRGLHRTEMRNTHTFIVKPNGKIQAGSSSSRGLTNPG